MKCFICKNDQVSPLLKPYRGGTIFRCNKCTNAFTYPNPRINYKKRQFLLKSRGEKWEYRSYARPIIDFLSESVPRGRLLDVGCGSGYLIEEAIGHGFQGEGLDPSKEAVEFCQRRNLKVKCGFLQEKYYPAGTFDVVVASHVLEHVADPERFLHICRKLLKRGGVLCLTQTNYTGTIPCLYGRFWEGFVPNEHFVHFSPSGIQFLLMKTGFKIKKIKILPLGYHPYFNIENLSTIAASIYYSISYLISRFKLWPNFTGDQMYILASK